MTWRTVVVSGYAKLDYKMDYLVVRKKEEVFRIHLSEIYVLLLDSTTISITTALLSELTKKKIKMRAGETDKSVSFKDEKLFALIEKFVKEMGYLGQIDIDIFDINGEYYISEVNPRFGGGYPHAYESGVNNMKLIINNLDGRLNKKLIGQYDEGVFMMKYNEVFIKELN